MLQNIFEFFMYAFEQQAKLVRLILDFFYHSLVLFNKTKWHPVGRLQPHTKKAWSIVEIVPTIKHASLFPRKCKLQLREVLLHEANQGTSYKYIVMVL